MKTDCLIIVASWEDRFLKGLKRDLENNNIHKVILFYVEEYLKFTAEIIKDSERLLKENNIKFDKISLKFSDPVYNWLTIRRTIIDQAQKNFQIIFDYSTTPRSIFWMNCFFLRNNTDKIKFIYHKPSGYSPNWLSRDPDKPRLVYKMSGLAKLGRQTLLVIITGYDNQRLESLLAHFEPSKTLLLVQKNNEFKHKKFDKFYKDNYLGQDNIEVIEFDSYNKDLGYNMMEKTISDYLDSYNIIATSLGPKPSALSLFKLVVKIPQIALCYVSSKEYNKEYSYGIGGSIECVISTQDFEFI